MATPHRIVWHTQDPHQQLPPGPGSRVDFITVVELLRRSDGEDNRVVRVDAPTHVVYVDYGFWKAEFSCHFTDRLSNIRFRRMNRVLANVIATPQEIRATLGDEVDVEVDVDVEGYAFSLRGMDVLDDDNFPFIQLSVLCTSVGFGPHVVSAVAKRYNSDRMSTENEELLTDAERRRLGISDADWRAFSGFTFADDGGADMVL